MILMQLLEIDPKLPPSDYPLLAVARGDSLQHLQHLYFKELCDPYLGIVDGLAVTKYFRKDGPLENYAIPSNASDVFVNIGTLDERIAQLVAEVEQKVRAEWKAVIENVVECNSLEQVEKIQKLGADPAKHI